MNTTHAEGSDKSARREPVNDAPEPQRTATAAHKAPFVTVAGRALLESVWTNEDGKQRRQARVVENTHARD